MKVIKRYVCEYTEDQFDDLTELVEFLEDILNDKQSTLANKLSVLSYSEIVDAVTRRDTLDLFKDIVELNQEIEQCKFVLETENSAPC